MQQRVATTVKNLKKKGAEGLRQARDLADTIISGESDAVPQAASRKDLTSVKKKKSGKKDTPKKS